MALRSRIGDEQTSSLGGWLFADLFLLIMVVGLAGFNITAEKGAPSITTGSATNVTASSATLNALADAGDATASVFFRWGKSANLGDGDDVIFGKPSSITAKSVGVDVQADLAELEPDTKYYFQAVAKSSVETVSGEVKSFITDAITKGACSELSSFEKEPFEGLYTVSTAKRNVRKAIDAWVLSKKFVDPTVAVAFITGWSNNPATDEGARRARDFYNLTLKKYAPDFFDLNSVYRAIQNSDDLADNTFGVQLYFVENANKC
jgi:hypothetical protein